MDRIKDQVRPDDVVILGYAWYYKERHVAAPARLRSIRDWMATSFPQTELSPKDRLIRARLDGAGRLVLDTIAMHCKFDPAYCSSADPSPDETDRVSIALLRAIAEKSRAKIYLLHFFGPKDDPVLAGLPGNVELIEATPADFSYVMRDDIMGFDDHGGPYWHYAMYSRLMQDPRPRLISPESLPPARRRPKTGAPARPAGPARWPRHSRDSRGAGRSRRRSAGRRSRYRPADIRRLPRGRRGCCGRAASPAARRGRSVLATRSS